MQHDRTNGRTPLPEERRQRIVEHLRNHGTVSIATLETEFGVSAMTARRDLDALEQDGKLRRTYGGAVLPELAAHEDSFQARLEREVDAKERLAAAAVARCEPGSTVYLDSSSTAFYVAKLLAAKGPDVTVLTNCLPIMELLATTGRPELHLIGLSGALRRLTQSFVGPQTVHAVQAYVADFTFMSIKGLTPDGHLTDPDALEAEVKRAMIRRARQPMLLMDGSKLRQSGLCVVGGITDVAIVLATAVDPDELEAIPHGSTEIAIV